MEEITVLTPTGCIGNRGLHREALIAALDAEKPNAMAVDAGSLDCGPWYLGTGQPHSPIANIRRDLEIVVTEGVKRGIPVIVGSVGGSGGKPHVDLTLSTLKGIAMERRLDFKVGVIYADVEKEYLIRRIREGREHPTGSLRHLRRPPAGGGCREVLPYRRHDGQRAYYRGPPSGSAGGHRREGGGQLRHRRLSHHAGIRSWPCPPTWATSWSAVS